MLLRPLACTGAPGVTALPSGEPPKPTATSSRATLVATAAPTREAAAAPEATSAPTVGAPKKPSATAQPSQPTATEEPSQPAAGAARATGALTAAPASAGEYAGGRLGYRDEYVSAPQIAELAAQLGYDPARIFAPVRDEVAFGSYQGILRGAPGTMWGRAGNAADQATLLYALLRKSGVEARLTQGTLSQAEAHAPRQAMFTPALKSSLADVEASGEVADPLNDATLPADVAHSQIAAILQPLMGEHETLLQHLSALRAEGIESETRRFAVDSLLPYDGRLWAKLAHLLNLMMASLADEALDDAADMLGVRRYYDSPRVPIAHLTTPTEGRIAWPDR